MDKYTIAPPSGSTNNSVGAENRPWHEGHFDSVKLNGGDLGEYLDESTGYGIVSGCEPSISGLTVTVAAGVVHLAGGTRKELSATNITLDAADSTNPRIDLVYITADGVVAKITGTAAASPSAPTLPSSAIQICKIVTNPNMTKGVLLDTRLYERKQNYLPILYNHTQYEGSTGISNVYYSVIPAQYQPRLMMSADTVSKAEPVSEISYEAKATLAINAGYSYVINGEAFIHGPLVVDGIVKQNGVDHLLDTGNAVCMTSDGKLHSVPDAATTEYLYDANSVWCIKCWKSLVEDGVPLWSSMGTTNPGPQTWIAQDAQGNYFVGVCEGRNSRNAGFGTRDIYDFTVAMGFTPYFLCVLDGGGSSQFVYHGVRINDMIRYENRAVPNALAFVSPYKKSVAEFDATHELNKKLLEAKIRVNNDAVDINYYKSMYPNESATTDTNDVKNSCEIYLPASGVTNKPTDKSALLITKRVDSETGTVFQTLSDGEKEFKRVGNLSNAGSWTRTDRLGNWPHYGMGIEGYSTGQTTFTAPTNGYLNFMAYRSTSGTHIEAHSSIGFWARVPFASIGTVAVIVPMAKGQTVQLSTDGLVQNSSLRFMKCIAEYDL